MADAPQTYIHDPAEPTLLRTMAAVGFLKSEYAMRVGEAGRYALFFPTQVRSDAPAVEEQEEVVFDYQGALDNVFATLVVRLARSGLFRLTSTWRRRAVFAGPSDETCALTLRELERDGGEFVLGFERKTSEETRLRFDEYVKSQLSSRAHAGGVQRNRRFYCPQCGQMQLVEVNERRRKGHTSAFCTYCETEFSLLDRAETADDSHHALIAEMNRAADARRDLDVAALTLRGKSLANDYDVFFSSHPADKERVDELDGRLREQGILSRRNVADLVGGHLLSTAINDVLKASKAVVFVIGEFEFSAWQTEAMSVAPRMASERRLRIATVVVRHIETAPAVPEQLAEFPVVDMREFTPAAMEQLVEAITGQSGRYIDPNAGRLNVSPPPPPRVAEMGESKQTEKGVLRFDRKTFFDALAFWFKKLNQSQVSGLDELLGFIEQDKEVNDIQAAAFILALIHYETAGGWQPVAEMAHRSFFKKYEPNTAAGRSLGNTQPGDGFRFRTRGYLPITGRANYQRLSTLLGVDLIADPDATLEPTTAYRLLSAALYQGLLTGKKLGDFMSRRPADYKKMLAVIGHRKSSDRIPSMAGTFEKVLRASLTVPDPAARKETPDSALKSSRAPAKKSALASSRKSSKKSSPKVSSSKTKSRSRSSRVSRSTKSSRKSSRKSSVKRARPYKK